MKYYMMKKNLSNISINAALQKVLERKRQSKEVNYSHENIGNK